jgi:multidrug efflux pump subunit AcrB
MRDSFQPNPIVKLFVEHPTASNLLMVAMVVIGLFSLGRLNTQFFPTIEVPMITVSVTWSGASASDVEEGILDILEPELRFVDGIDTARSVAMENGGTIILEFKGGADMQKALSDVEQAVTGVTNMPEDAEEPKISQQSFYERVANLSVSGPFSETVLKDYAKQLRDGLLAAGIDRVAFNGMRDEEIWVRVREQDLRRLNLSISEIAAKIRENSRDTPSGTLEGSVERLLRSKSDRKNPTDIGKIEIRADSNGQKIMLADIAELETKFDRNAFIGVQNGQRAIELKIQRAVTADTLKTMEKMNAYLDAVLPTLPPSLKVEKYKVSGEHVAKRLGILVKNGASGLVLVMIILFLFLNGRIAFWVVVGIPVSLMAAFGVMWFSGQTINMVSMFALIMMLGIIVDDAIVVGEHTASRQAMGDSRLQAAERGASRMLKPVIAATLTTQAAFLPIFFITGRIGEVMSAIPLVVVAVLIASLLECFLILPGHLRHGFGHVNAKPGRFRTNFDTWLNKYRDGIHKKIVTISYNWRYTTVALMVGAFIIAVGLIAGGRMKIHFFPSPEPENISARMVFAAGTPQDEIIEAIGKIDAALQTAEQKISPSGEKLIVNSFAFVGTSGRDRGDNLAEIDVQLTNSEQRSIATRLITKAWRKHLPKMAGLERIAIIERRGGPPGRDVDIRLQNAPADTLKEVSMELRRQLQNLPGVSALADDLPYGKPELIMEVTSRGQALGFTNESVGRQVRNAFEGAIANKFARGDEEITVRVVRVQEADGLHALNQLYLRSPSGRYIPLREVVSIREKKGFSTIQRYDGMRTVSVTADLDLEVTSVAEVAESLAVSIMPPLMAKYGISYKLAGRADDRKKSFADLRTGAMIAMVLIYIILAWVFESYFKPLAVMAIIPFGAVGAIFGHAIMGQNLTIVSLIGLLGLSGILVNDSIILVTQAARRINEGEDTKAAAIGASQDRLRAVLLTSFTTIGGLTPLLFETSRQAQFLIPMAITIVFGLATATILVLILVPSMLGIGKDIANIAKVVARPMLPQR